MKHLNKRINFELLNKGDEIIVFVCEENNCNRERLFEYVWGDDSYDGDDEFEGIDFTKTNEIIAELKH